MNKNIEVSGSFLTSLFVMLFCCCFMRAQVVFEKEVKISDIGLYFDGSKVTSSTNTGANTPYDYYFGKVITPHGDCIKVYNQYVFMTWYRGGKGDRHVMLSRYNTETNTLKTIEFPHQHTGYLNQWWIGESHNTIAIGISPLNGSIHLIYDMHAYSNTRPSDGSLSNDYFRYSYSKSNAVSVADEDFNLSQFVKDPHGDANDYKHLSLNGTIDYAAFSGLTYPKFFLNDSGDLFMYIREGGNNNGAYKFTKYNANTSTWSDFTQFNVLNAKNQGEAYNWGLYGNMKYVNGKVRVGFQRRSSNNSDKFLYQNGVYYAYSDNQDGLDRWKDHKGTSFTLPLLDADKIKVMEPGDLVETTAANQVYIVGDFDWTVTNQGDVHVIHKVQDRENNVTKRVHTYKPSGASDFITSTDFSGASSIYTSGEDIYIIGLTSGRVFIEKGDGGTNNFTRIYQATTGKVFSHGKVHISNGKLYYYLMEKKTGNAQPMYLQIIDLGITEKPFNVTITSPTEGEEIEEGETVGINAKSSTDTGSIVKVEFFINNQSIGEDFEAPYAVNWGASSVGNYAVKAISYDDLGDSLSSTEVSFIVNEKDYTDLTGDIYRLKNIASGKYLKSSGSSVTTSDYVENDESLEWEFIESEVSGVTYYNIDSQIKGILRATGANDSYTIINTSKAPPAVDVDKIWTVHYNESDKTYRFEARTNNRYLYYQNDNMFYNLPADANDTRSKWTVELASEDPPALSISSIRSDASVKVYPNPTNGSFTIELRGLQEASVSVYNLMGQLIFRKENSTGKIFLSINDGFKPGVYIVRVQKDNSKIYSQKLIVK